MLQISNSRISKNTRYANLRIDYFTQAPLILFKTSRRALKNFNQVLKNSSTIKNYDLVRTILAVFRLSWLKIGLGNIFRFKFKMNSL